MIDFVFNREVGEKPRIAELTTVGNPYLDNIPLEEEQINTLRKYKKSK